MSEVIQFKDVIDVWYDKELGTKYQYEKPGKKTALQLYDIFATKGLKIVQPIPNKLSVRLSDIVAKIKKNQKASRSPYADFKDIEKLFYSATEFPGLCKIEETKR